jgi:hypothetical protein
MQFLRIFGELWVDICPYNIRINFILYSFPKVLELKSFSGVHPELIFSTQSV